MAGNVLEFSDGNFDSEVLKSEVPVLVDFWAPWCGPCRMLAPTIEKLANAFAETHKGKLKIGKMNTDDSPNVPGALGISSIPTVIIFHHGKPVERLVGVNPESKYKTLLEGLIA